MKMFIAFAALVAVAAAGRLPHHSRGFHSSGYHYPEPESAPSTNTGYNYPVPEHKPAASHVDNSYLATAASHVDNSYLATAASQRVESVAPIVLVREKLHDNNGLAGYEYSYELSDGQKKQETAELINAGSENEAIAVRGSFSWVDPTTNQEYTINYIADENGFQPQGAHIPSA